MVSGFHVLFVAASCGCWSTIQHFIWMWCSLPLYRDDVVCTTLALPEVSQTCFNDPKWCRSLPSNLATSTLYNPTTVFAWFFIGIAEPLDDMATAKWQRPAWEDGWRSIFSSISKGCRCSVSRERYRGKSSKISTKRYKKKNLANDLVILLASGDWVCVFFWCSFGPILDMLVGALKQRYRIMDSFLWSFTLEFCTGSWQKVLLNLSVSSLNRWTFQGCFRFHIANVHKCLQYIPGKRFEMSKSPKEHELLRTKRSESLGIHVSVAFIFD